MAPYEIEIENFISLPQIWHMSCMQGIWLVCTRSVLSYHIPVYVGWMSVVMKCWITMMILWYHGMVPLQHLCDIGAVTVRFLCNLTETHLALIRLWIEALRNKQIVTMKQQDIIWYTNWYSILIKGLLIWQYHVARSEIIISQCYVSMRCKFDVKTSFFYIAKKT